MEETMKPNLTKDINLEKYLNVLAHAKFNVDARELKNAFREYGVTQETTFHRGKCIGDGEIQLSYNVGNKTGLLIFNESGRLYEAASGKTIASISMPAARFFYWRFVWC